MLFSLFFLALPQRSFAGALTWPSNGEVLSLGPHLEYPWIVEPEAAGCSGRRRCLDRLARYGKLWLYLGCLLARRPVRQHRMPNAFLHIGYPLLDEVDFEFDASSTSPNRTISVGDRKSFDALPHSHRHFI